MRAKPIPGAPWHHWAKNTGSARCSTRMPDRNPDGQASCSAPVKIRNPRSALLPRPPRGTFVRRSRGTTSSGRMRRPPRHAICRSAAGRPAWTTSDVHRWWADGSPRDDRRRPRRSRSNAGSSLSRQQASRHRIAPAAPPRTSSDLSAATSAGPIRRAARAASSTSPASSNNIPTRPKAYASEGIPTRPPMPSDAMSRSSALASQRRTMANVTRADSANPRPGATFSSAAKNKRDTAAPVVEVEFHCPQRELLSFGQGFSEPASSARRRLGGSPCPPDPGPTRSPSPIARLDPVVRRVGRRPRRPADTW